MAPGDYASAGTGKLKLKGVKDSKVDKKNKKKSSKPKDGHDDDRDGFQDRSVMLKKLAEEDEKLAEEQESSRQSDVQGGSSISQVRTDDTGDRAMQSASLKTEAERRYEEQRRKRLEERLQREGIKTHKERVEELNRYLSNLSEHHDMPKIGPG